MNQLVYSIKYRKYHNKTNKVTLEKKKIHQTSHSRNYLLKKFIKQISFTEEQEQKQED